jgi:Condensation domain
VERSPLWGALRDRLAIERDAPALRPASRDAPVPLTAPQSRLWRMERAGGGGSLANSTTAAVRIRGRLRLAALERSLRLTAGRHEALRTAVVDGGAEPAQIATGRPPEVAVVDLVGLPGDQREAALSARMDGEATRRLDLATGSSSRAVLLRLSDEEHVLFLAVHHLVSDGSSLALLLREVSAGYDAIVRDGDWRPGPVPLHMADFAAWQRAWLRGKTLDRYLAYWRTQRPADPAVAVIPPDRPPPDVPGYRGRRRHFSLAAGVAQELRGMAAGAGVTLFVVLLAVYQVLLWAESGETDVLVATPFANRGRGQLRDVIGLLANLAALRTRLDGDPTFRELLARTSATVAGAGVHQAVPLETLIDALRPGRDIVGEPPVPTLFVLQNYGRLATELTGLTSEIVRIQRKDTWFDLSWSLFEEGAGIEGRLGYRTDLFGSATVERLVLRYQSLAAAAAARPDDRLGELVRRAFS